MIRHMTKAEISRFAKRKEDAVRAVADGQMALITVRRLDKQLKSLSRYITREIAKAESKLMTQRGQQAYGRMRAMWDVQELMKELGL